MTDVLAMTEIPGLKLKARGKVRDIYDLGDELLIVATDRISTFDVVLPTPIPRKGEILTRMSRFWFKRTEGIVPNQISARTVADVVKDREWLARLGERAMVVKKARPLPVEAIVRGYISGSGWSDYRKTGSICGVSLPAGMRESEKLPKTIFTPSTKAEIGLHDENISFERAAEMMGDDVAGRVRDISVRIYEESAAYARERGIIIADTKFEFGMQGDEIILIDEVLTPDSSRFWPVAGYAPGRAQPSFDKQYVRDWLVASGWDKTPPAPELPPDVVAKTAEKYSEALRLLTA
ncbi:MAG: phosphoribosylaminoimidazolesuccinocarboxamide synthase [Proteobacteria bacterium]|nr:phosphoribosylaminoimidazolesuccinocarboxamide synthase [Pseudomonadota bacterium]